MVERVETRLPNGQVAKATYRTSISDAAYVRVMTGHPGQRKLITVSGRVESQWDPHGFRYIKYFRPEGKNSRLVK